MSSVRLVSLAGAMTLIASAAMAADMPLPPPLPMPVVEDFGGWYLRGDIGFSNQQVKSISNANYANYDSVTNVEKGFDSAPFFGVGVGYQFNNWLRFDVTGEYRGKANFHGFDIGHTGGASADDRYTASKSELTFLANAYFDLGTWYNVTPFVGAGIGMSRNTISDFTDASIHTIAGTTSAAYAGEASQWNFAWALHAGLAYHVTPNMTVELAYRYLDLGNAKTGDLIGYDGSNSIYNPMEFHHLYSNDVKLGIRWALDPVAPAAPAFSFPALSSRG